jgi:hypothetical protein
MLARVRLGRAWPFAFELFCALSSDFPRVNQSLERRAGIEPAYTGFADLRVRHFATGASSKKPHRCFCAQKSKNPLASGRVGCRSLLELNRYSEEHTRAAPHIEQHIQVAKVFIECFICLISRAPNCVARISYIRQWRLLVNR